MQKDFNNRRLISCEGPDGCGKTTLAKNIFNWLLTNCYIVELHREPGGTPLGEKLRHIILSTEFEINSTAELFMFCAARSTLVNQIIVPALNNEKIVILDRFTDSTRVYQGYAGNLDLDIVNTILQVTTGGLEPSITFLPLADVETLWHRSGQEAERDRIEQKGLEYLNKVRNGYLELAKLYPNRIIVLPTNSEEETLDLAITELRTRGFF